MTPEQIESFVFSDSTARILANEGNDIGVAERINAAAPDLVQSRMIREKTIFAAFTNPLDALSFFNALDAVPSDNQYYGLIQRAKKWLEDPEGLDIGHPATRAILDALETGGVLTADQVATVKALANARPSVSHQQVSEALAKYRPDGIVQDLPANPL